MTPVSECKSIQINHNVTLMEGTLRAAHALKKIYFENLKPVCTSTHLDEHFGV